MKRNTCIWRFTKSISILFVFNAFLSPINSYAQKVFVPGEDGTLIELDKVEAKLQKTYLGERTYQLVNPPKNKNKTIVEPFIIYFKMDDLDLDEINVCVTSNSDWKFSIARGKIKNSSFKKYVTSFKKIDVELYEVQISPQLIDLFGYYYLGEKTPYNYVISYEPNKNHKKEGKIMTHWYGRITTTKYNAEDITEWSETDAIDAISNIINDQPAKKLFTLNLSESTSPYIHNNNQIQYVIVQNQEQIVQQQVVHPQPNNDRKDLTPESDVDKNIPYRDISNENAFALIIANENYNKVASVPFANRDGLKLKEYLKKTLGLPNEHITLLENATLNDMRYELNKLKKISDAYVGECSFIVYYCGHGIPDEKNGNGYLLPVDGYGTDVNTAYSLAELYSHLGNLNAKKTILFTDACFSGAGKEGNMLVAARGIAIKSKANEATGNLIAFSACQGDETAYSYKDKGHGLMTYYFLKKLQESQGKATLGELEEYIIDNVGKTAIVTNGKSQTPSVSVSPTLQSSWRQQTLFE